MEAVSFSSDALAMEKLIVSSFAEAMVADTLLAAQRSLACFLMVTEALLKDGDILPNLIGAGQRFPVDELHRRKRPEPENKDGSDTEDDDEEDDDDADQDDDDAGDEDFSGEEGGENDEEGDPEEEPVANGNGGSDDEDEDEDEDDDDDGDEDGDEDENEEEEDEDEDEQPPAKKRK